MNNTSYALIVRQAAYAVLRKALNPVYSGFTSWWPTIQESFAGAWQQNVEINLQDTLQFWPVFRCISIISSDIAKLRLKLVEEDDDGIWVESRSAAFSPVLQKPNAFQTRIQFVQSWLESKLARGNTYILLQRDGRNIVRAMYVLDPTRVKPLVSDDTQVFYQLLKDNMAELDENAVVVPASEIIHDRYATLSTLHPLIGVSPLYAAGLNALGGLNIQKNSALFFGNNSQPGGILTAPGAISDETAARLKSHWDTNFTGLNVGKIAVLGDGLKYERMAVTAEDAQLIEQLKWDSQTIAGVFGVPSYMLNIGAQPPYTNPETATVQYYSQCLQVQIKAIQSLLKEGLALPSQYGVHFDLDELLQMDTATRFTILRDAKGTLTLNEMRRRVNLGKTPYGDTIYMQQQDRSLAAVAEQSAQIIEQPAQKPGAPQDQAETNDGDETSNQRRAFIEGAKRQILRYGRRAA